MASKIFRECAHADYEALEDDREIILYISELLQALHKSNVEGYNIYDHWYLKEKED